MTTQFSLDLTCARRQSGLKQSDCAHLLGRSLSSIARLESGERLPSLTDICTLSLVFGRSFEPFFESLFSEIRAELKTRLISLPPSDADQTNRQHSVEALRTRLEEETTKSNAA